MTLQDAALNLYQAQVTGGELHIGDRTIQLPFIRGTGTFRILYLDDNLRIFENPGGALAIQVRER